MTSRAQLPSIAFVLAGNSLRLPAYRTSHRLRYHPYPRYAPLSVDDSLMSTVDFRYTDPSSAAGSSLVSVVEEDVDMSNLDQAISGKQTEGYGARGRSLSSLVVELAFTVRQIFATIRAKAAKRN